MTTEVKDAQGKEVKVAPSATPKTPTPPALSDAVIGGQRVELKKAPAAAAETKTDAKATEPKGEESKTTADDDAGTTTEGSAASGEGGESTASGDDDDDTAGEPKKSKGGFQKRIDKLTRINSETQRRLDVALDALEKATGVNAKTAHAAIEREDPKPVKSGYEDPEKFTEDLAAWSGRQGARAERAEREAMEREAFATREMKKAQESYAELLKTGKEKYPDWDDVAESDVQISIPMAVAITRSKVGHDIQYYLGKHPKEAARIQALPDAADQLVEIGKLEAKVIALGKPSVSKAPNPVKPVGGASGATTKPRHEMTMEEYAAARQPELDSERRGTARRGRTH